MADTRINALTTSTVSVTDDFLPIDGNTAGTKKLSAYSPSFGGAVTVGQTLTVNGAGTSSFAGNVQIPNATNYVVRNAANTSTAMRMYADSSNYGYVDATANTELRLQVGAGTKLSIGSTGIVTIPATTASANASSGALVIGNGTQGGLGVGGSIHLGENLNLNSASGQIVVTGTGNTANSKELRFYRSDGGDWAVFGLTGTAYAGSLTGLGNSEAFIYNTNPLRVFIGTAATNRYDFTSNQFKINATTTSNNTSSGALVVSGGVGVAGTLCVGGGIAAYNDSVFLSPTTFVARSDGTNASLYLRANGTGKVIIDIGSGGLDVSAGPIRTAAPSGGTAANWKLGAVASVSPTSPNRTIEVDIGGTIYYIHAKTTNN